MTSPLEILSRTFSPVTQPSTTRSGCSACGTAICGVYLLIDADEIVYVGSSTDITYRLYGHERTSRMQFDRVLALQLPKAVMRHYEGALIRALHPKLNGSTPKDLGYDAEILFGLGLRAALADDDIAGERAT